MAKQPDRVLGPGAQGDVDDPGELVVKDEKPAPTKKAESKEDSK